MKVFDRKIQFALLFGDILCFLAALWATLFLRYGQSLTAELFIKHLSFFSFLFALWVIVFFIAGLYEKTSVFLRSKLREILLNVQIANALIAIIFFYFIPSPDITPKTNLFLYIIISSIFIFWWRIYGYYFFGERRQDEAIILGSGKDLSDLQKEVNKNTHYNIKFSSFIDVDNPANTSEKIAQTILSQNIQILAVDLHNDKVKPLLPSLYNLLFSKIRFIDTSKVYEDVFDRIPLSLVKESWFLENMSVIPKPIYEMMKRVMDIIISFILGIFTLLIFPFVALAIKIDDGGPIFFSQKRVGQNGKFVKLVKFRSMSVGVDGENGVSRVGKFIRMTRIDELPQLWNVFKGDLSLIGPRPEVPELSGFYEKGIPFYKIRNLIKPGLSGWAQLYQKEPPKFDNRFNDTTQTKEKLSYDLYYIKNRSIILDLGIALKTIKEFLLRRGV